MPAPSSAHTGSGATMSEQPEALRLADELDDEFTQGRISNQAGRKAAACLRRQHALIKEWEAKAETWLLSPEALIRLQGYRDLTLRAMRSEAERDALRAELAEYKSARNAYASEFPPDREGKHAVGIILQNIRTLKSERDALRAALRLVEPHLPFDWAFDSIQEFVGRNNYREACAKARAALKEAQR